MRNWPYAYSLGNAEDSVIAGLFDVSPLPAGDSGSGAATLGGWQLAVSKYSAHPEEAAQLALFMASYDEQKIRAARTAHEPGVSQHRAACASEVGAWSPRGDGELGPRARHRPG